MQPGLGVGENITGQIDEGLLVYLGVETDDEEKDLDYILDKVTNIRIFEDQYGKMNLSIREIGGPSLPYPNLPCMGIVEKAGGLVLLMRQVRTRLRIFITDLSIGLGRWASI